MRLNETHIAIRERGFAEILDLALHVIRAHAGPLALALLLGAAPWSALNAWVLSGMVSDNDLGNNLASYLVWLVVFVALQAPLATAPMTLYLGQATFTNKIDSGKIVRDFFRCLPQMLWLQGAFRCLMAVLMFTLVIPYVMWPYLSELILLERNPYFGGKAKRLTTNRRSRNLHRGVRSDLYIHWVASVVVGLLLCTVIVGGLHTAIGQLAGYSISREELFCVLIPVALWIVMGYFAVVRFLSYLDLRIRREGWEVELTLRGEAARLTRGMTP